MRPIDLWPTTARIIEVGATSGVLGQRLLGAGYENYLAVTRDEQRSRIIGQQNPGLRRRVVAALSSKVVQQNNADVLVLSGWSAFALGRVRSFRHAAYVALKLKPTPLCWLAMCLGMLQCVLFRLGRPKIVNCGASGGGPWLVALRVRRPRPHSGVRRFIPHRLGVCGLLYTLQTAGVRHAVLRWFETLPRVPAGEDLDLLVDDGALDRVRAMLDEGPGVQPVDVYSVTGLPGADFRGMPYFPPYLAEELLDRAVIHRGLCRVPAPREHFLSLAYHALYHKGYASGLPVVVADGATGSASANTNGTHWQSQRHPSGGDNHPQSQWHAVRKWSRADHDYAEILRRLAGGLDIHVAATLEGLDAFLDSHGWRPPHDMLIRLSRKNRWVRSLLRQPERTGKADDRIAVFLLREEGLRRGGAERVIRLLEEQGFQILATHSFASRMTAIARSLRGGNWGRGPWPISGGPPVAAIVTYDPSPIAPTRKQKKRFPFIANARLLCKEQIRDAFNEGLPKEQHCNVIHSSDNGREAMDYLRIIMPDGICDVLDRVASRPAARAA